MRVLLCWARAPVAWHSGAAPPQWRLSGRMGWFCPPSFQCLLHLDAVSSLKVSPCCLKYYLVFSIKKASLLNIPELRVSLHPVNTVIGLFIPQPSRCKLSSRRFFISLTFLGSCLAICCVTSLWGLQSCRKKAWCRCIRPLCSGWGVGGGLTLCFLMWLVFY